MASIKISFCKNWRRYYNKVKKDIETKEKEQQDAIKIKEKFEDIQKQLQIQKYLHN